MNNLKCPNCGADITTNDAQTTGRCIYCNSRFAAEKKPEPTPPPQPAQLEPTPLSDLIRPNITIHTGEKRPRIKFGLALIFLMLGPFFFFGYIILTEIRKKAWDKEHKHY